MKRREFDKRVRVEIIRRATRDGQQYCEIVGCGCLIKPGYGEFHHIEQDAMQLDKSLKLTQDKGLYICKPCHKEESKKQAPILAKALRREARHLGAHRPKGTIKSAGFEKKERTHAGRAALPPRRIFE